MTLNSRAFGKVDVSIIFADGTKLDAELAIGEPVYVSETEVACSVTMPGLLSRSYDFFGVDSLQALLEAVSFFKTNIISHIDAGGRFTKLNSVTGDLDDLTDFFKRMCSK